MSEKKQFDYSIFMVLAAIFALLWVVTTALSATESVEQDSWQGNPYLTEKDGERICNALGYNLRYITNKNGIRCTKQTETYWEDITLLTHENWNPNVVSVNNRFFEIKDLSVKPLSDEGVEK